MKEVVPFGKDDAVDGQTTRRRSAQLGESPSAHKTSLGATSKRILVVDDDSSIRQMLGRILKDEGYQVGEAGDGVQALEIVGREPFDLMLLDLNMPIRNGWDTFERLTTEKPLLPVIIITARPNQLFISAAAGVAALMEKPLDFPKLLQTISALLAEDPEIQHARAAGKRAEFYYQPAVEKGESNENRGSHHKLAGK
jgi:CheY-like chemotaxis protein